LRFRGRSFHQNNMLTRLTHAGIAFAVTVVIYQAYVLLAVPFIEPPRTHVIRDITPSVDSPDYVPVHKYRDLLAAYFPSGHWTLTAPPKSFDNGQAMIVLDDYQPKEDGEVRVNKCAVLFFPHERVPGEAPPRDAVILEAPHGAVIQLDEGFTASFKGIGRLQWARLLGDITVRSDMQEPGPQDDLLLKTRDLYMNQDLIRTDADVDMRLGEHWGKGKVLEIRLVAIERGKLSAGPDIGGIDTLEIVQNVEAHLAIQSAGLFDVKNAEGQKNPLMKIPEGELPPVHVTSQGRFKFDFTANVASFVEKVRLEQNYSNGARNRLKCDALNLFLAGDDESISPLVDDPVKATSVAGRTRTVSALHAGTIEAHGTELSPVELNADTHDAAAKCGLMRIELGAQRVTFSGQDEIMLMYQGNEIHAPMVQYTAPPKETGQRVGNLLAAGNGWFKAFPTEGNNSQPFEVRWTEGMELRRIEDHPVLAVRGRPRLTMAGGRLWADELKLVLRERAADGSEANLLPADVVPARMVAIGHVDIQSAELSGKVSQLAIDVNYLHSGLVLGNASGAASQPGSSSLLSGGAASGRSYNIDGESLAVEIAVRDGRTAVRSLDVTGDLFFRETAIGDAGAPPLVVRGKELTVRKADTPAAEISLKGEPATITAQGMSIEAVELQINRGTSGAMINSPGKLQIPMNRDLAGNPLATPEPLEIEWQGGMNLANTSITFQGDVVARTSAGQLNTNRLVAILSAPIQFDGTTGREQTQLAQIECWEGVTAQFVQRDAVGTTSVHKLTLKSILANQISGKVEGIGPGWLESVHLSTSGESPAAFADVTPDASFAPVAAARPAQNLRFLRIEFNRGVEGSLLEQNRHVAVLGNVHAVYGPVDAWEQKLAIVPLGSLGPETIYIESETLQVAQSPNARLTPESRNAAVELTAERNVVIEGAAGKEGIFTARAHRAKFDQQKAKFMLEGDGVRPAVLTRQKYPGGPLDEQSFNSLEYYQSTDEWKATGIGRGQINGLNINTPTQ
jgi:hypothetical protein